MAGFQDILSGITELASGLTNPFGVASVGQWNISTGVYHSNDNPSVNSVVFFFEKSTNDEPRTNRTAIDQISDQGGRKLAIYEYPYRDGQLVKNMGRKGEKLTFNIKFFGTNYQQRFQDFIRIVTADKDGGTLIHPVRGAIQVQFQDYEFIHRYDEWNAVTIKATFIENQLDTLLTSNVPTSQNSAIRNALQSMINIRSAISQAIFEVSALLLLPSAIINSSILALDSITGQISRLLGQLAVTYSVDAQLIQIAAQATLTASGSVTELSSGTVSNGTSAATALPPLFQVGFDPKTQAQINAQSANFVNSNQITPQQAVFQTNVIRQQITTAIADLNTNYGNLGYDAVLQYRALAISIQDATESAVSLAKNKVKIYTVPSPMSLRSVAKNNGLTYERQNDIEALNPYLQSVNYIAAGTVLTVPAS